MDHDMCGITGFLRGHATTGNRELLLNMLRAIDHRGPDDEGFALIDTHSSRQHHFTGSKSASRITNLSRFETSGDAPSANLGMGHKRFSIVDLSIHGHQPMVDPKTGVCMVFNGEIYNHVELRQDLLESGHLLRGHCDTEVLLQSYLEWGTDCFPKFNGPWALALWDPRRGQLLLSRDRIGKAPLYYTETNGIYWASEIKSLLNGPLQNEKPAICPQAVDHFIRYGHKDIDRTFWQDIHDFPAASFVWLTPGERFGNPVHYWSFPQRRLSSNDLSTTEATSQLISLLSDALHVRTRSDVKLAFELSGGMDSSTLVSLHAANYQGRLTTYTTKFSEKEADEEPFARAVAEKYPDHIDYHVIEPSQDHFWQEADSFVRLIEEPFHSPNLHTHQAQRKKMHDNGVRVVITGGGGDEVFAGYPWEFYPAFMHHLIRTGQWRLLIKELHLSSEYSTLGALKYFLSDMASPAVKQILRRIRGCAPPDSGYRPQSGVQPLIQPNRFDLSSRLIQVMGPWRMNYWHRSSNKSTFGIPIEPRHPFLDHRVLDFAFQLPLEYLIRDGYHKWILRQTGNTVLPMVVRERKRKQGFPFPHGPWMAHSKNNIEANFRDLNCPFIDLPVFFRNYDHYQRTDPIYLWRIVSLGLWWRAIINNQPITHCEVI